MKQTSKLFDLTGKIVLAVGGAGYLGLPSCRELALNGATVVIADNRKEAAQKACEELNNEGLSAEAMALDIGDENAIESTIKTIIDKYGRLDIAINLTFLKSGKTMEHMKINDLEKSLRVSLCGAFILARESGKVMVEQGGGSIIQFSSMYGKVSPDPRIYPPKQEVNPIEYGIAKSGIIQMVRYQAVMLAPHNVRVNAIVPGPFPNQATINTDPAFIKKLADKTPLGRVGNAPEISGAVVFLASDASSYVTGTEMVVDGGWTAW